MISSLIFFITSSPFNIHSSSNWVRLIPGLKLRCSSSGSSSSIIYIRFIFISS
jgi:hypothetical protein